MLRKLCTLGLATLCVLLFLLGLGLALTQQHKIQGYRAVKAIVLSHEIREESDAEDGALPLYRPLIRYRYRVGRDEHVCDAVLPMSRTVSSRWRAQSYLDRYPINMECDAYYNPANPAEAFLIREYSFLPYVIMLAPALAMLLGLAISDVLTAIRREVTPPRARSDGWLEVASASDRAARTRRWALLTFIWYALGAAACGHYFGVAARPYGTFALVATCLYGGLGLVPLLVAIKLRLIGRRLDDAQVMIDTAHIVAGRQFTVRIAQPLRANVNLEKLEVGLICRATLRTPGSGAMARQNAHEWWATLLEEHFSRMDEMLAGDHTFCIPEDAPATTPPDRLVYPRYAWKLVVRRKLQMGPPRTTDFPILVAATVPNAATPRCGR